MNDREVTFYESKVEAWCESKRNENPLHTDSQWAEDSTFGQRIVPGMMLFDEISSMYADLGDDDETVVLSGITAARYRDPVLIGETVTISAEIVEEDDRYTGIDFECRVEERGSLVANGAINVVID